MREAAAAASSVLAAVKAAAEEREDSAAEGSVAMGSREGDGVFIYRSRERVGWLLAAAATR